MIAAAGTLHRLDARAKLVGFVGLVIIAVSTPAEAHLRLGGFAVLLLVTALIARLRAGDLARRLLLLTPFLLVALAGPLLRPGDGGGRALGEMAKACLGCTALVLLAATTPFPELLAGLSALRCPRLVVLLLGTTERYLHLLGDEAARLRRAAVARGFAPRHLWQARLVGDLIGALFLRSLARAERVHAAMLARGFAGEPVAAPLPVLRWRDAAFPALLLGPALAWRLLA